LLLNAAYPLNRSHSKTIVVGLHAESWQPTLRVCSVTAHIDLYANETHRLLLLILEDLSTANPPFILSDRVIVYKEEVSGTPVFNLLVKDLPKRASFSACNLNNSANNSIVVRQTPQPPESSPFPPRGRRRKDAEMGRRFPLQAAGGAQRLQLLPPFPANDG